jgi:hypothetical protein
MESKRDYGRVLVGLIVAWLATVLIVSALHGFATDPSRPPLALLIGVLAPLAVFTVWYRRSEQFREHILSLNPRTLTMVHSWRVAGLVFLVLSTYGILPKVFALPAGWGDIAIGATALPAAMWLARPERRAWFMVWQALGMADLVMAISLGALVRFLDPQGVAGIATGPMTVLPLILIPGFGVPLMMILHGICIAQARRWSADRSRMQPDLKRQPAV